MANSQANRPDRAYTRREESSFVNVEAWTEEARLAISSLDISAPTTLRGTAMPLSIPLDDDPSIPDTLEPSRGGGVTLPRTVRDGFARQGEVRRRDSMKRREALLKGNEGSRRRQRWENGR
jgi:hypothetical protein